MNYLAASFSSGYTLIVSILIICFIKTEKPKRTSLVIASTICIAISLAIAWCSAQEIHFYDGVALVLYTIRWIFVITVAFGRFRWLYLYTAVLYESAIANFVYLFSPMPMQTATFPSYFAEWAAISVLNTVFLILIYISREKVAFWGRSIIKILPKHIYVLVLLAIFCLCGLTTMYKYPVLFVSDKMNIMNLLLIILTVVMTWMIPSLLISIISKQHFRSTSALLQKQVETQLQHYDKQERLNNEIRAFRHDYVNHLCSIRSLIQNSDYNGAIAYINKLLDAKHSTQTTFNTGNRLADAILSDKADILPEGINIDFHGLIPPSLDNMHLCVILTNALDNAVEACSKLSNKATIAVTAQEHQGYFVMTMTNPTISPLCFSDIPPTTKSDAEQHGMGLINIRNVVKMYDGQIHVNCKDHLFELSVTLKM